MSILLQNDEIKLMPFEAEDKALLKEQLNHPALQGSRYILWNMSEYLPLSDTDMDRILKKWQDNDRRFDYGIRCSAGQLIGHCHLDWSWDPVSAEAEVVVFPDWQGKGYGKTVMKWLLNYAFGFLPVSNVNCWVAATNKRGSDFLSGCGFSNSGKIRRVALVDGKFIDASVFDILRSEWVTLQGGELCR